MTERTLLALPVAAGAVLLGLAQPAGAQGYWSGGVWIGTPPPYYYAPPPPTYYPPPPPPAYRPYPVRGYGFSCYAPYYTCALPAAQPIGSGCSCPGFGGPAYGSVR